MIDYNSNIDIKKIVNHLIDYLKSCEDHDVNFEDVIEASSEIKFMPLHVFRTKRWEILNLSFHVLKIILLMKNKIGATPEMNFAHFFATNLLSFLIKNLGIE